MVDVPQNEGSSVKDIETTLSAAEHGNLDKMSEKDRAALLTGLFTQAAGLSPETVERHSGLLRQIEPEAAEKIIDSSMKKVQQQSAGDTSQTVAEVREEHFRMYEQLMRASDERKALEEKNYVHVDHLVQNGQKVNGYASMGDFIQDSVVQVNKAGKSSEGAADLLSMMEANKNQPQVKQVLENELKYQYDHASSPAEKERLGLVAAAYAKDDMANITANANPETKSFYMGMSLNSKYADLPKDVLHRPEDSAKRDEFVSKAAEYIESRVADAPKQTAQNFVAAHAENDLKTPLAVTNGAKDVASGIGVRI